MLLTAGALAVVSTLLLALPWWAAPPPVLLVGNGPAVAAEPDRWTGWELAGPVAGGLLAALVVAAAVLLGVRRAAAARIVLVLAGASAVAVGATALAGWGVSAPAVATVACGAGAAGLAAAGRPVVLVVALLAAAVPALPGGLSGPDERAAGPFVRVAAFDADELRSGGLGLPDASATAVVGNGRPGVVTSEGLAVLDAAGRVEVLARTPDGPPGRPAIIGVAGDRVVRWTAADAVTITSLNAGDPVAVTVRGVSATSRLGVGGMLWVRATNDPPGVARLLDLTERSGIQTADATYLPVVTINGPADSVPVDVSTVLPVDAGGVRVVSREAGDRLERLSSDPGGRTEVARLAGGLDPACGLAGSGPDSFLPQVGPLAADVDGGIWFVTGSPDRRLARLAPDGMLKAVAEPLPGAVSSLAVTPDGTAVLVLDGAGLWLLPAAATALSDLPAPPPGCSAAPAPLAPPVTLVPVGRTGRDRLGVPLGADGRWASAGPGGEIAVVAPDGSRTAVGVRTDGNVGRVWPDGSGGVWWLESPGSAGTPDTLVHGTPAGEQRFPPMPDPAPREGSALIPDLGGRPPLLATAAGAYRIESGAPVLTVPGRIADGVVRADGRGWVLADGGLLALDGDRLLGAVIDPGDRAADTTPVSVQLARGVPASALALPRATVALDGAGRAVVVADDVVLAVADSGAMSVVAQDARLVALPLFAAEGGLVAYADGDLLRVDLPS